MKINIDEIDLLNFIITLLENRITELVSLLNIYAPFTEAECDDIQSKVDQREAAGKKIPTKPTFSNSLETAQLYA